MLGDEGKGQAKGTVLRSVNRDNRVITLAQARNRQEHNFAGPVPLRLWGSGAPREVWGFQAAATIYSQDELSRLIEINSRGLPAGSKMMPRPSDIYPPDVHEIWWDANDIHTPILLKRLLIGELRAFGDRDRTGAWPEWIAPRTWRNLKRDSNKECFEGGGNLYWNVRVVPLEVVLGAGEEENCGAETTVPSLIIPKTPPAPDMPSNSPEQKPVWTATEALTWLAFGTPETWEQFIRWVREFCERWRFAPPAHDVERLLDAIGAAAPAYPWRPQLSYDGRKVIGYETDYAAPSRLINGPCGPFKMGAPELARAIRADHRRRLGRLVTYAELHAMLMADLDECRRRDLGWNTAHKRLRDAILQEQLVAWGVRGRDLRQEHVPVPPQVAFRAIQFREDCIEPDDDASSEDFTAIQSGERWVQVRFRSAEVIALASGVVKDDEAFAATDPKPFWEAEKQAEVLACLTEKAEMFLQEKGSKPKRDNLVSDCVTALGCGYREAQAAYKQLPVHLRRSRGEAPKRPKSDG